MFLLQKLQSSGHTESSLPAWVDTNSVQMCCSCSCHYYVNSPWDQVGRDFNAVLNLLLLYENLFHFQCLIYGLLSSWWLKSGIHLMPIQPLRSCLVYNLDLSLPLTGLLTHNSAHHEGLLRALLPWRTSAHIFLYNCKRIIKKD